jgi:Ion channel
MFWKLIAALWLMGMCVVIHAAGLTFSLRRFRRPTMTSLPFLRLNWLFIRLAAWLVLLHLIEVVIWAQFYVWRGAMPDLASSFYFSAVTYTTTGYGDLVLPTEWRLVGAVEALTGLLMCGWSTGFFFAVVNRMFETHGVTADSSNSQRGNL